MVLPLAVCVGLKLPHCEAGVQDQLTPAFPESPVTVAAMLAVPAMSMEVGGVEPGVKVTETAD